MNSMVLLQALCPSFRNAFLVITLNVLLVSGSFAKDVFEDCLIEPHMIVQVGSPVPGIIRVLSVDRGEVIQEGQVLAQMDADLEKVSVDLARERLKFLTERYRRLERIKSTSSRDKLDEAQTEMLIAELELKKYELVLEQKTILSHVKGVVLDRHLSPGEYVYEQAPILKIAQTDPLNVELLLPRSYYRKISIGQNIKITLEDPIGGSYEVKVALIDKVIDAASSSFGVRLLLPNPELMIPAGLKCEAEIKEYPLEIGDVSH